MPTENEVEYYAKKILKEIGIKPSINGYFCWIEAAKFFISQKLKADYQIISELYIPLGKKLKINASKLERRLRYAHNSVREEAQEFFNVTYHITNKDFLELLIEKVEEEIRNANSKIDRKSKRN